eukprot:5853632-Heterocapsa_arctica.AAC.1
MSRVSCSLRDQASAAGRAPPRGASPLWHGAPPRGGMTGGRPSPAGGPAGRCGSGRALMHARIAVCMSRISLT